VSNSLQSFVALMFGGAGLLAVGGLDAFIFHRFGLVFDAGAIITFATACGLHWTIAPVLPFGAQPTAAEPKA